ncbi:EF-hand domain-containing protein [Sphingomonas sp.]|jgi:Ca2+-binding EF-hand superfamily protein|uniref:EF-hand domain-containing protein n=1 Tax=Sphingomonas sp. TaxID=28214 RepID=UPI002E352CD4|nr:EF-hand domain-containing protein [Sphingomonas sp.]HEX4695768.1 EF-hand domain-containing protein [Sphingomonas sp.]
MLGMIVGWALLVAAQDKPPLAGTLPPMPAPRARPEGERPRGRLFISPMGEPFRGPDPVRQWFDAADTDHDGALSLAEFTADADRFFQRLDRGHDGEIDPDDIEFYETVLAPEIRTGGEAMGGAGVRRSGSGSGGGGRRGGGGGRRGGGGGYGGGMGGAGSGGGTSAGQTQRYDDVKRGAARFGFFDYPEPVTTADANFNRGIDPREFRDAATERFALLDRNHDGKIGWGELPKLTLPEGGGFGGARRGAGRFGGSGRPPPGSGEGDSGE